MKYIGMQFTGTLVERLRNGAKGRTRRLQFDGTSGDVIYCKESFRPESYHDGKLYVSYKADWDDPNLPKQFLGKNGEPESIGIDCTELPPDVIDSLIQKLQDGRVSKTGRAQWIAAMVMPRAIARIHCDIGSVQMVQLHSIDTADAKDEGFDSVDQFHEFWKHVYGQKEWQRNPMVHLIRFSAVRIRW